MVTAAIVALLIAVSLATDPVVPVAEDASGFREAGIEYGVDQCPLVELAELGSAMPELGQPNESLATGGPQYVCNFGGTAESPASLQVVGGSTGQGVVVPWDDWVLSDPRPTTIEEYLINEVPMWIIPSTSDTEQVVFRGPDRLVWKVDATLEDLDRARQIELTIARLLALS